MKAPPIIVGGMLLGSRMFLTATKRMLFPGVRAMDQATFSPSGSQRGTSTSRGILTSDDQTFLPSERSFFRKLTSTILPWLPAADLKIEPIRGPGAPGGAGET